MSPGIGTGDELGLDSSSKLITSLRQILVARWPERISMVTVIDDAGLNSAKYIVDAPSPDDRWHQTIKKLQFNNKILVFVEEIQRKLDEPDDDLTELCRLENERLEGAELKLRARALESFTHLLEEVSFTVRYIKQLREPENLSQVELAAIREGLHKFYEQLDKLREAQRVAPRNDEIAQANNMEMQANKCTDALQLYMKLVDYADSIDDYPQDGIAGDLGSLPRRKTDEVVLIRAKAGLRNALIRLGKAGGII